MCGLVGLISKRNKPVGHQIFNLYMSQKSRGSEGFGYVAIGSDKRLIGIRRHKTEEGIKKMLMKEKAEIVLFHHRFPTSTENTLGTTHPILVDNDELDHTYYFAHNGIITNKDALKKKHFKLGYIYNTEFTEIDKIIYNDGTEEIMDIGKSYFNDSESLAIELARFCDGASKEIGTTGAVAFWGIQVEKETNKVLKIYYGKNRGRDLKVTESKKYWGFSSQTGKDIDELKMHVIDLGKDEVYDYPLPIDAWYKSNTVHYGVGYGKNKPIEDSVQSNLYSHVKNYEQLENKEYTRQEAEETGVPLTEFFSEDKAYGRVYIPCKYAQQTTNRKRFVSTLPALPSPYTDSELELNPNDQDPKVLSLLEDYAMKYAELEAQLERIEMLFDENKISAGYYKKSKKRLEHEIQSYEEKVASLGVSNEVWEETYEVCTSILDHSDYSFPQEEDYLQDELEYIQLS